MTKQKAKQIIERLIGDVEWHDTERAIIGFGFSGKRRFPVVIMNTELTKLTEALVRFRALCVLDSPKDLSRYLTTGRV